MYILLLIYKENIYIKLSQNVYVCVHIDVYAYIHVFLKEQLA